MPNKSSSLFISPWFQLSNWKNLGVDWFINYSDLATQTTPIVCTAWVPVKLTNDWLGGQTLKTYKPTGIVELWNTATNQFDLSGLSLGDEISIRLNYTVTTSSNNQEFYSYMNMAIGWASYSIYDWIHFFKTAWTRQVGEVMTLYMGNSDTITKPAEIMFSSDANATIKVNWFYISVKKGTI